VVKVSLLLFTGATNLPKPNRATTRVVCGHWSVCGCGVAGCSLCPVLFPISLLSPGSRDKTQSPLHVTPPPSPLRVRNKRPAAASCSQGPGCSAGSSLRAQPRAHAKTQTASRCLLAPPFPYLHSPVSTRERSRRRPDRGAQCRRRLAPASSSPCCCWCCPPSPSAPPPKQPPRSRRLRRRRHRRHRALPVATATSRLLALRSLRRPAASPLHLRLHHATNTRR